MHSAIRNYLLRSALTLIVALVLACAICVPATAQNTFNTLASFDYTDGALPTSFTLGADGNFYGTTDKGGGSGGGCNQSCGGIYKATTGGTLTLLHGFVDTDGNGPSGIVQTSSGEFYGTTSYGGSQLDNPITESAISESGTIQECSHQGLPRLQHLQLQACLNGRR